MSTKTRAHEEPEMVSMPEDVPELTVEGTIVTVYTGADARCGIGREDVTSAGFMDLEAGEDGLPRGVDYSTLVLRT